MQTIYAIMTLNVHRKLSSQSGLKALENEAAEKLPALARRFEMYYR